MTSPPKKNYATASAEREFARFLEAVMNSTAIGLALFTTPGVPADRVTALRRAFDATMKDPQFLAEAAKTQMDISPSTGEEAQKYSDLIANTPAAVLERAKDILGIK